ncbi:hypothetical protein JCM16303_001146 [Sporobolomyces ruberrimus]
MGDPSTRLVKEPLQPPLSSTNPPEWMLRIMQERAQQRRKMGQRGGGRAGEINEVDVRTRRRPGVESCEVVKTSVDVEGMRYREIDEKSGMDRGETLNVGQRDEPGTERSQGRGQGGDGKDKLEQTRRLFDTALCIESTGRDGSIMADDGQLIPCHLARGGGGPSPHHHEFSSASSTSSTTSNSTGGFGSSSASSSGFSSRASGSSITSDSSTTTFSVSSHEREREKDRANSGCSTTTDYVKSGGGGGRNARGRSLSTEPIDSHQGGGGGTLSSTSSSPYGLGLYQSLTASPTHIPRDSHHSVVQSARYSDHSPLSLSPNPSRSPSFDSFLPNTSRPHLSDEVLGQETGGRDATILPRALPATAIERSSSPTPSTSTLTIDAPPPPTVPAPFTPSSPSRTSPSLKGKEKAILPPSSASFETSPPLSTITLTTTADSEASTTDNEAITSGRRRGRNHEEDDLLYPPENFAIVVPGIFRSSCPKDKNYGFLKSLRLKSVLTLIQDEYPRDNLEFLEREGIQLFQFPIPGNKEPFVHIPDDKIVAAMAVLLDTRNHPLLIHCNKGKHRTGCLVGVLRRLQTWSLTAIFDEYRRYSHPKSRQMDLQFIEAFKGLDRIWDLASQNRPHLPSWACTTPYSTPHRGQAPPEAKTKERSASRAPSGRSSPVLKDLTTTTTKEVKVEEDTGGGSGNSKEGGS